MELTKKEKIMEKENEIKLMAAWKTRVRDLVKKTGFPKNIEIDHEGDYILYEVDCDDVNPLEDAKEDYEEGWRLVSTKTENIPDLYGTGYALKLVK